MNKNAMLAKLLNPQKMIDMAFNGSHYAPPKTIGKMTVQDSVPVYAIHEAENLIETYPGFYTRMYLIGENNYQVETEEVQSQMFITFRSLFNSLGTNCEISISIFNQDVNFEEFKEAALGKEAGDEFDYLRREMNEIILDRIKQGKNGLRKCKYITLGLHTLDVGKAAEVFNNRLDTETNKILQKIGSSASVVSIEKRLEILHDIYNIDNQGEFLSHTRIINQDGISKDITSFDLENIRSMGLTVKDVIAPSSIQIKPKFMRLGKKYVKVMRITRYPSTSMSDEFFVKLTDVPFNILSTINIQPMPTSEANQLVNKNLLLAQMNKNERVQNLAQVGLSESALPLELGEQVDEAKELREEMTKNDEKLFKTVHTIVFWADSLEKLQEYTDAITATCQANVVGISTMEDMQEAGFNSTLPLLQNEIPYKMKRTLKSTSVAAASLPFSAMELSDAGGINYSMNLASKNLILYNRLNCQNYNGFILGCPGAGKSFSGKVEMLNVFLRSNAKCIIIDPEAEYHALATLLHGEIIKLTPGGAVHLNPLEITNSAYEFGEEETNPVLAKADFVLRLLETIVKTPFGLNSVQETIVDECVHFLFKPFMDETGRLKKIPKEQMPTLTDLQVAISKRPEPEARELSMALKLYTHNGSLNVFGTTSNVDVDNRFVVFDIKDVGEKLKPMAMLIILDFIQNNLFENRKRGINTWFWVDECHLLFQDEMTASTLSTIWKRCRKYGGVPTGITQNVEDLLKSVTCRTLLSNCNFIQILKQSASDREQLRDLLRLSDSQIDIITESPRGQGLIYTGTNCVGFYSKFPKNNSIYKCLTSNMRELKEYEEAEKRAKASQIPE